MNEEEIQVTDEMIEAVALADLYREDATDALRRVLTKKISSLAVAHLIKQIRCHENYKQVQTNVIELEKVSLVEDDMDTIMLYYNKLLKEANKEKKYEVAARILGEIRKLKAIENEQMKFEIVIEVEKPENKEG